MRWWVYVPARRLALPADVPRLGLEDVIGRRWHLEQRRDTFPRAWLLLPDREIFLPTQPVSAGYLRGYRAVVPLLPP